MRLVSWPCLTLLWPVTLRYGRSLPGVIPPGLALWPSSAEPFPATCVMAVLCPIHPPPLVLWPVSDRAIHPGPQVSSVTSAQLHAPFGPLPNIASLVRPPPNSSGEEQSRWFCVSAIWRLKKERAGVNGSSGGSSRLDC